MTYLLPLSSGEEQIERYLDQNYRRGVTYLYGAHEDYTRIWFNESDQVLYKSTPSFGASLLTLNVPEDIASELIQELELQSMADAAQIYFSSDSLGKIRAIMRLAVCLSLNAEINAIEADYAPVWIDALESNSPPLMVAALEASRSLGKVESVRSLMESRRESLLGDPTWAVLAERVFESWDLAAEPFFLPTRDVDRLLHRAEACIASGDLQTAIEALDTVVTENPYILDAHVLRARVLDRMGDHWGAWAAMSMGRLYAISVSDDPDLAAMDAFIELHHAKIKAGDAEVTPVARQIGISLNDSYTLEGMEVVYQFLADHDAEWRSKWLFLMNSQDPELLELEPGSKILQLFRGDDLLANGKKEEALAAWLQFAEYQEVDAESFDRFAHSVHFRAMLGSPNLTARFAQYINALLTEKSWDEAIEFAEMWENIEPEAIPLWVGRGIAETFSGRSEDAISSYTRAIVLHQIEGDQIYLGEHPVATAYFNRACELAKLNRIDDRLFEDLKTAVSLAPKFAEKATADDYLVPVFSDPRFETAITEGLEQSEDDYG